jgi:hypothetical protein
VFSVGYLLPFIPFQEMQYQNRDMKFSNRYVQTLPIAPLKSITSENDSKHDFHQKSFKKITNTELKMIREITGKGIYVDELI